MRRARRRALLLGSLAAGLATLPLGVAIGQEGSQREALVVLVPDTSFDELLGIPDVAALARAGGAALLVDPTDVATIEDAFVPGENRLVLDPNEPGVLSAYAEDLPGPIPAEQPDELLVIVMGGVPRHAAGAKPLSGVVVARGSPGELFPAAGPLGSLTSDSTRRDGVVTGNDVEATLRLFLGRDAEEPGALIRSTGTEAPVELYDRYLEQRRLYVPVGTAAALYVTAIGLAGIGALAVRRPVSERWRRAIGWAAFSVAMLSTGLLAAGHLPELSYGTAVPFVALVTVVGTMAFSPLEREAPTLVPVGIGAAVLAFFVVEAFTGWSGMLTPLLGGSQLDGGRFYGFPNVAVGLAVGAALWATHRLPTFAGFAVLCALGLFIGLPYVGSNLGGAVTAFVAAGLWVAIRERERLGAWRGVGVVAGVGLVGGAIVLLAHALAPIETHISAFEENVEGIGGVVEKIADRLGVGIDLIARAPAALVPVLGLPLLLIVVLRPPARIRATFDRWPAWRDAVLVTTLAGIVAYAANDSGPAAAGLAFGLALGGTLGVSLLAAPEKMAER